MVLSVLPFNFWSLSSIEVEINDFLCQCNSHLPTGDWLKLMHSGITSLVHFSRYYMHFEIAGDPCNLIGSHWRNLSMNCIMLKMG